jgi:hypothetical protein
MLGAEPRKIVRRLSLKKSATIIPLLAAAMMLATVDLTLFWGSGGDPRSISMAGASESGAIFFNLSLVLFLPLWITTLIIYHSESWVLAHGQPDLDLWWPPFTLSLYNGVNVRYWHRVIAIVNVVAYALLVSLPVDEFANEHEFSAGVYFVSLYLHLALATCFPVRHTGSDWQGNQIIRAFILAASTLNGFGLLLGLWSNSHLFELFEIGGSGFAALYIVSFAVEFRHTFNSISVLVTRTVEGDDEIVEWEPTPNKAPSFTEQPKNIRQRGEKLKF